MKDCYKQLTVTTFQNSHTGRFAFMVYDKDHEIIAERSGFLTDAEAQHAGSSFARILMKRGPVRVTFDQPSYSLVAVLGYTLIITLGLLAVAGVIIGGSPAALN